MFELHPTLEKDTVEVARLDVCRVLLMRDQTYPWLILVPAREDLRDLDDLSATDRVTVMSEIDRASKVLKALFSPYKINVAALGNMVEQLHIHVIARFQADPAWPGPVWGVQPPADYDEAQRLDLLKKLHTAFGVE